MAMRFMLRVLINIVSFYCVATFFPAVRLGSWQALLLAGIILALINMLIRPVLLLVSLPINFLTFGLFTLVINTWMVMLTDKFVAGLQLQGFGTAFLTALLISFLNIILKPLL